MIWGLSYLDFSILVAFLLLILAVGLHAARSVKQASDFYLGGRKLGKGLQFFLNFGNAAQPNWPPHLPRNNASNRSAIDNIGIRCDQNLTNCEPVGRAMPEVDTNYPFQSAVRLFRQFFANYNWHDSSR